MKTKKLVKAGMMLALGAILHYVVPPLFLQVKPDFLLATMFIAIMMMDDLKEALPVIIVGGILTAMTTNFPGGEIPNLIDKLISGISVYLIYQYILRSSSKPISLIALGFVGTLISGTVFLSSALFMVGLPFPLGVGILSIVVPTAAMNSGVVLFLYKVTELSQKRAMS